MFKTSRAPNNATVSKSQLSHAPRSSHLKKSQSKRKRASQSTMGQTERNIVQNRIQLNQLNATMQSTDFNAKEQMTAYLPQCNKHSRSKAQTSMTGYGSNPRSHHYSKQGQSNPEFVDLAIKTSK